jgi:hypothetical protein
MSRPIQRNKKTLLICCLLSIVYSIFWNIQGILWSTDYSDSSHQDSPVSSKPPAPTSSNLSSSSESLPFQHDLSGLPSWIQNYAIWHAETRAKFPGHTIFTDPDAPNLLIRTCTVDYLCGGLHDRLGQLPWDLYLANQTNRILFIWWEEPILEEFLTPNTLDWAVPPQVQKGLVTRRPPKLFDGILNDWNQKRKGWANRLDRAIERAKMGEYRDKKILRHSLTAYSMEQALETRLVALGETDMIHFTHSYGKIFRMFFRPSSPVQQELDTISSQLGLVPGEYSTVHLRVRYPRGVPLEEQGMLVGKEPDAPDADHGGLLWYGPAKDYAVKWATHAVRCSQTLLKQETEKIYMIADSNDLVRHFAYDLKAPNAKDNETLISSPGDLAAWRAVASTNIVARDMSMDNFHLDRQRGKNVRDYYSTFIDLLLASGARCIAYGLGRYGLFASKIAGSPCQIWYQAESSYGEDGAKGHNATFCRY